MVLSEIFQKNVSIYKYKQLQPISYSQFQYKQFSYDNNLDSTNTCLVLNPPENLTTLFNQFNDFSSNQKQNSDNIR